MSLSSFSPPSCDSAPCLLRVVLFVSSSSSSSSAERFRPRADATQWWNRRDAWVRCVAALLYGPQCTTLVGTIDREIILLMDSDWSYFRFHRRRQQQQRRIQQQQQPPTEQRVISLMKQCSQHPGQECFDSASGLVGRFLLSPSATVNGHHQPPKLKNRTTTSSSRSSSSSSNHYNHITHCHTNKRELLEYLHTNASLDFLRLHHLNSSPKVVLRKVNQTVLRQLVEQVQEEKQPQSEPPEEEPPQSEPPKNVRTDQPSAGERSTTTTTQATKHTTDTSSSSSSSSSSLTLESVLQNLLQPPSPPRTPSSCSSHATHHSHPHESPETHKHSTTMADAVTTDPDTILAGILHESSHYELPCFQMDRTSHHSNENDRNQSFPRLLCLFAGAVRDMSVEEGQCLERVCRRRRRHRHDHHRTNPVSLVRIRLGPVPEFTSKILSLVAFHHAHGRLTPALQQLVRLQHKMHTTTSTTRPQGQTRARNTSTEMKPHHPTRPEALLQYHHHHHNNNNTVRFVCFVPLDSSEVTTDLNVRQTNRVLWCLVRCVVVTLWRSKVAGNISSSSTTTATSNSHRSSKGHNAASPPNDHQQFSARPLMVIPKQQLTLIFQDGLCLNLGDDLVTTMAEQHQAAPCEYQILAAIVAQIQQQRQQQQKRSSPDDFHMFLSQGDKKAWRTRISSLVDEWTETDKSNLTIPPPTRYFCILLSRTSPTRNETTEIKHQPIDLAWAFYHSSSPDPASSRSSYALAILSPFATGSSDDPPSDSASSWKPAMLGQAFATKHKIPFLYATSLFSSLPRGDDSHCQDEEAATITVIQHFCYQQRFFSMLESHICSPTKRIATSLTKEIDQQQRKHKRKKKR